MVSVLWIAFVTLLGLRGRITPPCTPDALVARNLEMLVLAMVLRLKQGPVPVIYEVLDVHRIMVGPSVKARMIRWVEQVLLRRCDLVIVSSPGFVEHYFRPYLAYLPSIRLVENKPLAFAHPPESAGNRLPSENHVRTRTVIGWFGILRCSWTLACLDTLTRRHPGKFSVLLRGKPALDALPQFHQTVAANPDLHFGGPYRWPDDLAEIYADVDLAWLIDRYDAGANSDWLLPNRLYEGALHGAVPLALNGTQVESRLRSQGIGVIVDAPSVEAVETALMSLTGAALQGMRDRLCALPKNEWLADTAECEALVEAICGLSSTATGPRARRKSEAVT